MGLVGRLLGRIRGRDRRRYLRVHSPPLEVRIGEARYTAADWSLGGFRIGPVPAPPEPGERVSGTVGLPSVGDGEFVGEVVSVGKDGAVGIRLLEIAPAVFVAMSGLKQI